MSYRLGELKNYRYKCPNCDSHNIVRLTGKQKVNNKTYAGSGIGQQNARKDRKKNYRCKSCRKRLVGIYDKKKNQITQSV